MSQLNEAIKIANRSSIRTHKTGAVIFDRKLKTILSNGWSHVPHYKLRGKRSLHAEMHALARGRDIDLTDGVMFVATVSGKSGNIVSASPCLDCAIAAKAAGIKVIWFTLYKSGNWINLNDEKVFEGLKVYGADGN